MDKNHSLINLSNQKSREFLLDESEKQEFNAHKYLINHSFTSWSCPKGAAAAKRGVKSVAATKSGISAKSAKSGESTKLLTRGTEWLRSSKLIRRAFERECNYAKNAIWDRKFA